MWIFNVLLFLCFLFAPAQYDAMVAAGAPCYTYMAAWGNDQSPEPVCFYVPVNPISARPMPTGGRRSR